MTLPGHIESKSKAQAQRVDPTDYLWLGLNQVRVDLEASLPKKIAMQGLSRLTTIQLMQGLTLVQNFTLFDGYLLA